MDDKSLSTYAHNVKIVSKQGKVTLKGPVRSEDEKKTVAAKATEVAGAGNSFDLLISDIALPDGSGLDLMMQLRAISKIPGIAISGFGNNGDIERSLQAGFSDHLIKPIKLDDLEAAIERAIAG